GVLVVVRVGGGGRAELVAVALRDVLVRGDGAVADLDLQRPHVAAALLQVGQEPLDLLLAHLLEQVLELLLGRLQLLDGLGLVVGGVALLVPVQLDLGLLLVLVGVLHLLLDGVVVGLLVLLAGLLRAGAARLPGLAAAGLAGAGLAVALGLAGLAALGAGLALGGLAGLGLALPLALALALGLRLAGLAALLA